MNKAYKYRFYPTKEQEVLLEKHFGACRWMYNKLLDERIQGYKKQKETGIKHKNLTPAAFKEEFSWLSELDSQALVQTQQNLNSAYDRFYTNVKKKTKKGKKNPYNFPQFKTKKKSRKSYRTCNINTSYKNGGSLRIEENKFRLPKIGLIKVIWHRAIPEEATIKNATISKTNSNKYFISIGVELPDTEKIKPNLQNVVGLDFSLHNIFVTSEGEKINHPKWFRSSQKKLARKQRRYNQRISEIRNKYLENGQKNLTKEQLELFREELSQAKNLEKKRLTAAIVSEKVSNQRKDYLFKLARELTNKYDVIVFEDINLQTMSRCLNLGKSVYDTGFGMFRTRIEQICKETGKVFYKVDKWFPSSKTCSRCGHIFKELKLGVMEWNCPHCGIHHDRDINAAVNLRDYWFKNIPQELRELTPLET